MPYKKHKQYRLPGYDYSAPGDYFITICTKNRIPHFGKITKTKEDAIIELTAIGSYVNDCILSIPDTYKEVTLGETVVMPNHIHLILHLPYKEAINNKQSSLQQIISPHKGLRPLVTGSVSSIVNHLKGNVKKWCNQNGFPFFEWQGRFHDHIIRDSRSYNRISNYIANNIWNWANDENNKEGDNFRKDICT
ncbi:MAG: transposase [Ferruginibacter sp.]|nr:transposase [Ferruginibacter sp.]